MPSYREGSKERGSSMEEHFTIITHSVSMGEDLIIYSKASLPFNSLVQQIHVSYVVKYYLGWHADWSLNLQALLLGSTDQVGTHCGSEEQNLKHTHTTIASLSFPDSHGSE